MTTTASPIDSGSIRPLDHSEAYSLAEEQYRLFAEALGDLEADDWERATDCEGWTVRDMAGHVLGAMRSAASFRELLSQQRAIKRRVKSTGENEVDAMTAVQIERTRSLAAAELVEEARSLVETAARGRHRTPLPMRRFVRIPVEIGSLSETWRLGYLVDTILTRDILMHRIDLARAIGSEPVLDGQGDPRLVADIVGEWARRHGQAFRLTLTGPAGGVFAGGVGANRPLELSAVEFCRILSGRGVGEGLLAQEVPF